MKELEDLQAPIQPPCACKGPDCRVRWTISGSKMGKYKHLQCLTHGTKVIEEPISIKIFFTFADHSIIEETLL